MNKITDYLTQQIKLLNLPYDKFEFLAGDASTRKYYKLSLENSTKILMFEKDGKKNIENFLKKTELFNSLGMKVPKIFGVFLEQEILILEDFGDRKYSQILNKKNELKLYKSAIDSLLYMHRNNFSQDLKPYSSKIYFEESKLFFDWYLKLYPKQKVNLDLSSFIECFLENLLILEKLPIVNIHRDFHVDNLFFFDYETKERKCAWIDYQDALVGPCVYDVMSILEDARRDLTIENKKKLILHYIEELGLVEFDIFMQCFKILAIQRHLKVLGIFSRLALKEKKIEYLRHIPRVRNMLISNLSDKRFKNINSILKPLICI
tara:strand:+ start:70 stop:1029 length:960 start_codon:yes stop_codon:yes gene_type:complete